MRNKFRFNLAHFNILLLFVFLFLFFYRPIETGDAWWHLSTGRWIVKHHSIPDYDIFNILGQKIQWLPTQWLAEVLFYTIHQIGGIDLLKLFRALLFISFMGFFFKKAYSKLPKSLLIFLTLAFSFALSNKVLLRPLIFNFVFIQFYLVICLRHLNGEKNGGKGLFLIPLLSALWFNFHIGVSVYGSTILISFFLYYFLQTVQGGIKFSDSNPGMKKFLHFGAVIPAHFAAFFINPFGMKGAILPFRAIFDPTSINRKMFFNIIVEMKAPGYIFHWTGVWFFILLMTTFLLLKKKKAQLPEWILLIISTFLFLYSGRSLPFFISVCLILIGNSLTSPKLKNYFERWKIQKTQRILVHLALGLFLSAQIYFILTQSSFFNNETKTNFTLQTEPFNPTPVLKTLEHLNISGTAFAWEGYGNAITWEAYPQIKSLVDGRQADLEAYFHYLNISRNPEEFWPIAEKKYRFKLAILDANFGTMNKVIHYLIQQPDWKLIIVRGPIFVFAPVSTALPEPYNSYATHLRDEVANLQVAQNIINSPQTKNPFEQFIQNNKIVYSEPFHEGVALFLAGYKEAGINLLIEANQKTPSSQTRNILRLCLEEYSSQKP